MVIYIKKSYLTGCFIFTLKFFVHLCTYRPHAAWKKIYLVKDEATRSKGKEGLLWLNQAIERRRNGKQ
jgi:hypothetical protein